VRLGSLVADGPHGAPPDGIIVVWVKRGAPRSEALLLMKANREGLLESLPAAAAWASPDGALAVLPGGSFLNKLTKLHPAPFAGGELVGTERDAEERAKQLAPSWLPYADGSSRPPLTRAGWLAIEAAGAEADQLHRLLEEVPLFGQAEAQRWGDVATVLRAAHGYKTLSCWLAEDGSRGELRLSR
jgi:hypothetical protein